MFTGLFYFYSVIRVCFFVGFISLMVLTLPPFLLVIYSYERRRAPSMKVIIIYQLIVFGSIILYILFLNWRSHYTLQSYSAICQIRNDRIKAGFPND